MTLFKSLALALALAMPANAANAQMRPPIPLTVGQFAAAPIGRAVTIAIRIDGLKGSSLHGELLRRKTDSLYESSGIHVMLFYPEDTPIVMGSAPDIVAGAVVFVDGIVTSREHLDVKQLLVVTKFVTVAAPKA